MADYITLESVCRILNISDATGRNWIRLGKLIPNGYDGKKPMFSKDYLRTVTGNLDKGNSKVLKSRRNKKRISGSMVYKDYIEDTENESVLQSIIDETKGVFTENELRVILANFAVQLFLQLQGKNSNYRGCAIDALLKDQISIGRYNPLIFDLLGAAYDSAVISKRSDTLAKSIKYVKGQDVLGLAYISLNSLNQRKSSGTYYTPMSVARDLVDEGIAHVNLKTDKIFDPACGSGNILLYVSSLGPSLEQMYGQDIDEISIQLTRINMAIEYRPSNLQTLYEHFVCGNTLKGEISEAFDFIIGNPPWGYEFSCEDIEFLSNKYDCVRGKNVESYDVFAECSLRMLKDNGRMAFVLPEAVLHVRAHHDIRELLIQNCCFEFVSYIGNVFSGVQCPAILLGIKKSRERSVIGCKIKTPETVYIIKKERQLCVDEITLNMADEEYDCINKILNHPDHCVLMGNARFALGIVTGDNKTYISDTPAADKEIVLKGNDIYKFNYAVSRNYITFVPESFQQTAPTELYRAPEKLLYRFICDSLVFAYDNSGTLSLNSCNIVIPQIPGLEIKYILAVLNSRAAEFFWKKKFNSIKILRSHIEQIPIPVISKQRQEEIIKIVDRIRAAKKSHESIYDLYNQADDLIMQAFQLNENEILTIKSSLANKNLFLPKINK